jgi:hypothetical protein
MIGRITAALLGLLVLAVGLAPGRPPGPPAEKLTSVVHDVGDLLHQPGRTGLDSIDELICLLAGVVNRGGWARPGEDGPALLDLGGGRLEVRAGAKHQSEVKDLLDALRRQMDIAVELEVRLIEVDLAVFAREVRPRLGKEAVAEVDEDFARRLLKKAVVLRLQRTMIANGKEAQALALRQAVPYRPAPAEGKGEVAVVFHGLTLRATAVVSADRRSVRLRLAQHAARLVAVRQRSRFDLARGEVVEYEEPELAESSSALVATPDDGVFLLLPALGPAAEGGRVRLLLAQPIIRIAEEDRARGNNPP